MTRDRCGFLQLGALTGFGALGGDPIAEGPVPTQFELANGGTQPFVHFMWDEDTIEEVMVREAAGTETTARTGTTTGGDSTSEEN